MYRVLYTMGLGPGLVYTRSWTRSCIDRIMELVSYIMGPGLAHSVIDRVLYTQGHRSGLLYVGHRLVHTRSRRFSPDAASHTLTMSSRDREAGPLIGWQCANKSNHI